MIQLMDTSKPEERTATEVAAEESDKKLKMDADTELKEIYEFCENDTDKVIAELWENLRHWRNEAYRSYSMIAKLVMTWKSTKEFLRSSLKEIAMGGWEVAHGGRLEFNETFSKLLRYANTGVDENDPVLKDKVLVRKIVQRTSEDESGRKVDYGILECGHEIVIPSGVDIKVGSEVKCPACKALKDASGMEDKVTNEQEPEVV
jgi:hypothetical protein